MGDIEDGITAVVALESRLSPGSFAAVWRPAQSEADAGRLEIVRVRELLVRGPKAGYRVQEEMDISSKDGGWLKGDLLEYEPATNHVQARSSGVRFIKVACVDVVQPVHMQSTGERGVLQLVPTECDALAAREPQLREAACAAARDRAVAKQHAKEVADQVKRVAGQTDMSKLTIDLIKQELRARRERGERTGLRHSRSSLLHGARPLTSHRLLPPPRLPPPTYRLLRQQQGQPHRRQLALGLLGVA